MYRGQRKIIKSVMRKLEIRPSDDSLQPISKYQYLALFENEVWSVFIGIKHI